MSSLKAAIASLTDESPVSGTVLSVQVYLGTTENCPWNMQSNAGPCTGPKEEKNTLTDLGESTGGNCKFKV